MHYIVVSVHNDQVLFACKKSIMTIILPFHSQTLYCQPLVYVHTYNIKILWQSFNALYRSFCTQWPGSFYPNYLHLVCHALCCQLCIICTQWLCYSNVTIFCDLFVMHYIANCVLSVHNDYATAIRVSLCHLFVMHYIMNC